MSEASGHEASRCDAGGGGVGAVAEFGQDHWDSEGCCIDRCRTAADGATFVEAAALEKRRGTEFTLACTGTVHQPADCLHVIAVDR